MKFDHHFEPITGWMNDPNGLCYYGGKYHAFFQYNPYAPTWDTMHWGHAVSDDLVSWRQIETALYPDQAYENMGGCFSGSALEKDGKLYLFYTAVSKQYGQAQASASSRDSIKFEKSPHNPIIPHSPYCNVEGQNKDFRDPKVFFAFGKYYMVVGAAKGEEGQILLYSSLDLVAWDYVGVLYASSDFGGTLECPDLFPLGEKWVLMFSAIKPTVVSTVFVVGTFDGTRFAVENETYSAFGQDFYAPQTLLTPDGRRVMIGWFYHWHKPLPEGAVTAGALSIARELTLCDGRILNYPVREARHLLQNTCDHVRIEGNTVTVLGFNGEVVFQKDFSGVNEIDRIEKADILFDQKAVEIFLNGGAASVSQWLI